MRQRLFITGLATVLAALALPGTLSGAFADSTLPLLTMHSQPRPKMDCQFHATLTENGDISGLDYLCRGDHLATFGVERPARFTIEQIRQGIVLMRFVSWSIDIIELSAPDFDSRTGGEIHIRYLTNGITRHYDDFYADVQRLGDRWALFTPADQGRIPFHEVDVTTYLLGVKKITVR